MELCGSVLNSDMAHFVCNNERGHKDKHSDTGFIGCLPYKMEWTDEEAEKMKTLYPDRV